MNLSVITDIFVILILCNITVYAKSSICSVSFTSTTDGMIMEMGSFCECIGYYKREETSSSMSKVDRSDPITANMQELLYFDEKGSLHLRRPEDICSNAGFLPLESVKITNDTTPSLPLISASENKTTSATLSLPATTISDKNETEITSSVTVTTRELEENTTKIITSTTSNTSLAKKTTDTIPSLPLNTNSDKNTTRTTPFLPVTKTSNKTTINLSYSLPITTTSDTKTTKSLLPELTTTSEMKTTGTKSFLPLTTTSEKKTADTIPIPLTTTSEKKITDTTSLLPLTTTSEKKTTNTTTLLPLTTTLENKKTATTPLLVLTMNSDEITSASSPKDTDNGTEHSFSLSPALTSHKITTKQPDDSIISTAADAHSDATIAYEKTYEKSNTQWAILILFLALAAGCIIAWISNFVYVKCRSGVYELSPHQQELEIQQSNGLAETRIDAV